MSQKNSVRIPDTIVADYRSADRSEKARLRATVDAALADTLRVVPTSPEDMASAMTEAIRLRGLLDAMKSTKPEAAPVDYVSLIANHRATLVAAIAAIDEGKVTLPEGVEVPDFTPDMVADGTPGEVAAFVKVAGRKAGRGSVAAYVEVVLQDATPGDVLTIADLRKAWTEGSHKGYPVAPPSAGAIAAFLDRGDHGYEETTNTKGTRAIIA